MNNDKSEYSIYVLSWRDGMAGMDGIGVSQDSDQWRVLVNTVMNLLIP
jgi:hypothetical protein